MAARSASTRRLTSVASGVLLTAAAAGGLALPAAAHDHSHQHGTATTAPAPTPSAEGHVHQHVPATQPAASPTGHSDHTGHSGHSHPGDSASTPADRPRAAVIGGFAAVNSAVLAGALVARRRGLAGHPPRVRRG
jgi:hypothetical protein